MKYAYQRTIAHRRIYGTDHPVQAVVYKVGQREWVACWLCNGVAEQAQAFRTRREAIRWAEAQ